MKPLLLGLAFFVVTEHIEAQSASWFYGAWSGETYFPNGPITKRIIVRLQVTKVTGNNFTATMANLYPNDTTVRLKRDIKGIITKKGLRFVSNEQTYIRDPRTQNFWHDCTGCTIQSTYSFNSSQVVIKLTTGGCGDVCDGETTFSRDTSDFDSTQKIQLAKWFGLPLHKEIAQQKKKQPDSTAGTVIHKPADSLRQDGIAIQAAVRKDTIASVHQPQKKESLAPGANAKKDSVAVVRTSAKQRTGKPITLIPSPKKKDSLPLPALSVQDTVAEALTTRTTNLVNTFRVTSPHITVQLFDNAEIDGDKVTVYHNGSLIVSHQTLTHKAITISITASKADPHHDFIMIADNLGLTPPNTALMRITAGAQKFELEVSSDYDNNAKITIEYTGE